MILASSCQSRKSLISSSKSTKLSISELPVIHNIVIPRDSAVLRIPLEIDRDVGKPKPTKAKAQAGRSQIKVEITDQGELIAQALCDEYKEQITLMERTIREHEQSQLIYEEKERSMSKFVRQLKSAIIISIIAFVMYVVITNYKIIKNKLWQKK